MGPPAPYDPGGSGGRGGATAEARGLIPEGYGRALARSPPPSRLRPPHVPASPTHPPSPAPPTLDPLVRFASPGWLAGFMAGGRWGSLPCSQPTGGRLSARHNMKPPGKACVPPIAFGTEPMTKPCVSPWCSLPNYLYRRCTSRSVHTRHAPPPAPHAHPL